MYSEQKEALAQEIELKRPAVLAVSGLHNSGKTTLLRQIRTRTGRDGSGELRGGRALRDLSAG